MLCCSSLPFRTGPFSSACMNRVPWRLSQPGGPAVPFPAGIPEPKDRARLSGGSPSCSSTGEGLTQGPERVATGSSSHHRCLHLRWELSFVVHAEMKGRLGKAEQVADFLLIPLSGATNTPFLWGLQPSECGDPGCTITHHLSPSTVLNICPSLCGT